jgi:hypothetical protein
MAPFPVSRVLDHLRYFSTTSRLEKRYFKQVIDVKFTTVEGFLIELKASAIPVDAAVLSVFLSGETGDQAITRFTNGVIDTPKSCTADQARLFLSYFPLQDLGDKRPAGEMFKLSDKDSACVLIPLMRWNRTNTSRLEILRMLLEKGGANPNSTLPCAKRPRYGYRRDWSPGSLDWGRQPLHIAAARGDYRMAEVLLEFHADPDAKDWDMQTAAELAYAGGFTSVVDLLVSRTKAAPKTEAAEALTGDSEDMKRERSDADTKPIPRSVRKGKTPAQRVRKRKRRVGVKKDEAGYAI